MKMKSLFENNLEYLRTTLPAVHKEVVEGQPLFNVQLEQVENSDTTNFFIIHETAKCFIHSVYSVRAEMKSMFESLDKSTETLMLYGFGCGHAIDYVKTEYSNIRTVIIIEPCLELFCQVLHIVDLAQLFSSFENVVLLLNKNSQECAVYLSRLLYRNLSAIKSTVSHLSYRALFSKYIHEVEDNLTSVLQTSLINYVTEFAFRGAWTKNQLTNLLLEDKTCFEDVMELFRGSDAIVVSAGPSLARNMHLLQEVRNKAFVVAVGTAIKILDTHGIIPHMRVAIDGGENEKRVFEGINTCTAPLLYANTLHPSILKGYQGNKFEFLLNVEYMAKYLNCKLGMQRVLFNSGFSVAVVTADILCSVGCRRVIFVGQDLCYTDNKLYAPGSWRAEDEEHNFEGKGYIKTKDVYGNVVYTTKPFLGMKRQLEERVLRHPHVRFINATEGGLYIEGMEHTTLETVLATLDNSSEVQERINSVRNLSSTASKINKMKLQNVLDELAQEAEEIIQLNEHRLKRLEQIELGKTDETQIYGLEFYDWKLKQNELFNQVVLPDLRAYLDAINYSIRSAAKIQTEKELLIRLHKMRGQLFLNYVLTLKENINDASDTVSGYKD